MRDAISGGSHGTDLDLAVQGDGYHVARTAAARIGSACSFVPLDPGRGTARLVFKEGSIPAIDISTFKGPTIREDLIKRDFTINAIAVPTRDFLTVGRAELIDPCGGEEDLLRRKIRVCSDDSFADDPLRILRAFRFAAALGFTIDAGTRTLIPSALARLASVAGERVRDEVFAILAVPRAFPILQDMDAIGVMETLFPEISPMKGCTQNAYHHLDVWAHSLEAVRTMEGLLSGDTAGLGCFKDLVHTYAERELVAGRPRKALMKLAVLFHDSGKPNTRFVDDRGRVRFFGHDAVSTEVFALAAERLRLSSREIHAGAEWIQGHMRPIVLFSKPVSRRGIFRLWRKFGEEMVGLFILFLADLAATRWACSSPRFGSKCTRGRVRCPRNDLGISRDPFHPSGKREGSHGCAGIAPWPETRQDPWLPCRDAGIWRNNHA